MNTNLFKQIAAAVKNAVTDSNRAVNELGTRLHTAAIAFIKGDSQWRNDPAVQKDFQVISDSYRPLYVWGYLSCLGLVSYYTFYWMHNIPGATHLSFKIIEKSHMLFPGLIAAYLLVALLLLPYAPLLIRPLSMLRTLRNRA